MVKTLGIDSLSKSQVSRMATDLDQLVEEFRHRSLGDAGPFTSTSCRPFVPRPGRRSASRGRTIGDQETTRLELRVPGGYDLSGCNAADIGLQVWYSEPADKNLRLLPGKPAILHIFEVEGQRQVFVVEYAEDATADELAELEAVLDSIEIDR